MFLRSKNKLAFTLAEVLITLGIIGIVAAMTIPSLLANKDDAANKAAFKKTFSAYNQYFMNLTRNGQLPFEFQDDFLDSVSSYFSVTKACANAQTEGCWHDVNKWSSFNNTVVSDVMPFAGFIFSDGSLMTFVYWGGPKCDNGQGALAGTNCIATLVDVNGFTPPNKVGKDIFGITLFSNKILPEGAPGSMYNNQATHCTSTAGYTSYAAGMACASKVLMNEPYN